MDYALPYDVIKKAPGFKPMDRSKLYLKNLKENSLMRAKSIKDFIYLQDDVDRMKKRIEENVLSLNREERLKDIIEADVRLKARNKERVVRFKKMQQQDEERYTFYSVKRRDLKSAKLPVFDPNEEDESYMLKAENKEADLDITPDWPSRMDPVKREGMAILNDLINFTKEAKVVKTGTSQ